ncbi:Uncharacterised protein [Serratia entomophila]|nr:Uncharacterised protein [Serratia entomophila]CAI1015792.1 Uncharacterised protein [Serratia entomophila]CAI1016927.1 Uncharacterised protein [Serratia entomophila]CAI1040815.1 Uncharacterised protein [Serratia entomophila]CAI1063523.1 Uncharacterised protein [Serratia entomophila]
MQQSLFQFIKFAIRVIHRLTQLHEFRWQYNGLRSVKRDIFQYAMETTEHFGNLLALMHPPIIIPINLQAIIRFINLMIQRDLRRLRLLVMKLCFTAR